jgi:3-oxoacyl-[acyl-carrier protein] reductase
LLHCANLGGTNSVEVAGNFYMGRLQDQVAIITGGSRGIGRAVARALAREGARVAIAAVSDRNELETARKEIADLGSDVVAMLADVARRGDVDRLVQTVVAKWGRVDILVNNAGVLRLAPLENISEERWDETLAVHLKGTFNCTQAVLPFMKQRHKGKIINIAAP